MTTGNPFASHQGWSSLQRPVYSPGLLLEDDDLNVGVSYTQDLMRLMLKSLFGCGVVCGLDVTIDETCQGTKRKIVVNPGVAVDGEGNLIEVGKSWDHEFGPDCEKDQWPAQLWVVLCYKEKCCRPKDVSCSPDDDSQSRQTRVRAGFEINLWEKLPKCTCRCASAADKDSEQPTDGGDHTCCGQKTVRTSAKKEEGSTGKEKEEPCPCYAEHFKGVCGCNCCRCVVLAKIATGDKEENKDKPLVKVDPSMVRRVRPVLNGYVQCLDEARKKTTATAGQGTSPSVEAAAGAPGQGAPHAANQPSPGQAGG